MQLGAEQVDTLATGDLGVEVVLAGHLAQHYELVRGDLAAGNARHHRVGAVLLHVRHEGVVGVLQRHQRRVHYRLVPAGSEDGADGGLADIASDAAPAMAGQHVLEALDTLHADDAVQLLTGVGEVLAQTVIHRHTPGAELVFEHLLEQRAATAAAGTSPGRRLEFAQVGYAGIHLAAHRPLADVVAGADGGRFRQGIHTQRRCASRLRQDQAGRVSRQADAVLGILQQTVVVAVVTDQHSAEQVLAVGGDHHAPVGIGGLVDEAVAARARCCAVGVADRAYIHTQQLQLGGHVGTGKRLGVLA